MRYAATLGVTILAVLCLLGSAVVALSALSFGMYMGVSRAPDGGRSFGTSGTGAVGAAVLLIVAAAYLAIGLGLWKLRNWGRILAMVLAGVAILGCLIGVFQSIAQPAALAGKLIVGAIQVAVLVYLNRPHVKLAFAA